MVPKRRATSRDVARLAGVSPSAVSLVLNGAGTRHGLAAATQDRVRDAARELGYIPNHAAASLRRRSTGTIALLTADLANPYFAEFAAAAERAARERGRVLNIIAMPNAAAERDALSRLAAGVSDGLLVHGSSPVLREGARRLHQQGLACVLLQDPGEDDGIACVRVDIAEGGFLATRHLLALGHTRIAHVTDRRMRHSRVNERLQGYRRALDEAGIEFDPALVLEGENSLAGGDAAMRALLDGDPRPTAVFLFNDRMAIGALHALAARGLRAPDDIAVVGFDGTEAGAFCTPELTTIDHPRGALGRLAAEAVLDQLDGRAAPPLTVLPVHLVVRRSCGAEKP